MEYTLAETIALILTGGSVATALIMLGIYLTASDRPAFGNANFNSSLRKRAGITMLSWASSLYLAFPLIFMTDNPDFEWWSNLENMAEMIIFAPPLIWLYQALFDFENDTKMGRFFWNNAFVPLYLYIPTLIIMLSYFFAPAEWQVPASYFFWGTVSTSYFVKYIIDKIKYKKFLLDNYSNTDSHDVAWVDIVIVIMLLHFSIYVLCSQSFMQTYTTYILLCIDFVVCIFNAGYLTWSVDHMEKVEEKPVEEEETKEQPLEWVKSVLDEHCVQSSLYLNPDLTLTMLAERTGIGYKTLSRYFSSINKNYNRYINELRIEHAKTLIKESCGQANLAAIAEKSGYTNVYTFRRVFKEIVNCLPSQYGE